LENLRKLNNELDIAHIDLESQLYQECDLKDEVIQELTTRYGILHKSYMEVGQKILQSPELAHPLNLYSSVADDEKWNLELKAVETKCLELENVLSLRSKDCELLHWTLGQMNSIAFIDTWRTELDIIISFSSLQEYLVIFMTYLKTAPLVQSSAIPALLLLVSTALNYSSDVKSVLKYTTVPDLNLTDVNEMYFLFILGHN
jgi:hypothetical protein